MRGVRAMTAARPRSKLRAVTGPAPVAGPHRHGRPMTNDSTTARRRASFTALDSATREELALVREAEVALYDDLPRRILDQLEQLHHVPNGHPVPQLEH